MRDESEFSYGGEADISRPPDPLQLSDTQWADYLFMRKNTRGVHRELWNHQLGCRRWFVMERDTVSYRIIATHKIKARATKDTAGDDHAG